MMEVVCACLLPRVEEEGWVQGHQVAFIHKARLALALLVQLFNHLGPQARIQASVESVQVFVDI